MYKNKLVASNISLIEYTLKKIYFRNVYLFLKYIRDIVNIKDIDLVRINLWTYFKGPVLK